MRPAKQIFKLLTSSRQARSLLKRVAQNKHLTSMLQSSLPSPLADFCQAGDLSNNKLTIVTASPVWAAKLRYLLPSLLRQLQNHQDFSQVTEINIKISNQMTRKGSQPKPRQRAPMSHQSANVIQQTAETITDKALRDSLLRLSRHGKKPENSEQ